MLLIIVVINFVCVAAGILPKNDIQSHIIQGVVIFVIVFVNILLSVMQEVKASKTLDALKKTCTQTAKVRRDGIVKQIPASELVIGDVVFLEDGIIVPADLYLIECNSLKIEEGALTGESLPSEKDETVNLESNVSVGDRINCAFSSTTVSYGSGVGVVFATGMNTEIGKIATLLNSSSKKELPPLKQKINKLVNYLTIFAFSLLAIMILLNVVFYFAKVNTGE
jgi:Ca2+-transporting ATPase